MDSPSCGRRWRSPAHCGDQCLCHYGLDSCPPYGALLLYRYRQVSGKQAELKGTLPIVRMLISFSLFLPTLITLSVFASSLSQPILIQPPSISASLGVTARLTCNFSNDFSVGSYQKSLYQQKPRTPPQHLLRFLSYLNKHQSFRVPSRFSGSKDTSANAGLLIISGLQP